MTFTDLQLGQHNGQHNPQAVLRQDIVAVHIPLLVQQPVAGLVEQPPVAVEQLGIADTAGTAADTADTADTAAGTVAAAVPAVGSGLAAAVGPGLAADTAEADTAVAAAVPALQLAVVLAQQPGRVVQLVLVLVPQLAVVVQPELAAAAGNIAVDTAGAVAGVGVGDVDVDVGVGGEVAGGLHVQFQGSLELGLVLLVPVVLWQLAALLVVPALP
eukprot:CAMPEP_0174343178 /NCGR_PEP_ID=MMETSP0810-20121108/26741_1 /TAXON_ID=73025 ORGANISM="Eutreptiella gymnastica-like, Strain CCMP1594" /NCGR_SAMPLE_ID=MMETSP0810 /ASSEMBLY_ACC=CAM_ASM_000659 /LENGTH=214 /DNA_ID=CAMNT_0015465733 /DNA_START=2005 /DNA_END=2650 /DNA_ORIENTATION=-